MTFIRLSTVAPELIDRLSSLDMSHRKTVCLALTEWAIVQTGLEDSRVEEGLSVLRAGEDASAIRSSVESFVQELDEKAWDLQDEAEAEGAVGDQSRYERAFERARAANTLWYALDFRDPMSVLECAYEAQAANGGTDGLALVVDEALVS